MSYHLLHIASLPALKDLQSWQNLGVYDLINVSAVNLHDIYESDILTPFNLVQIGFADIFDDGHNIADNEQLIENITAHHYQQISTIEQRLALLKAVQIIIQHLQQQIPTCIFCHRGLSRSPLVVAAALQQFYRETIKQAIMRTLIIQPQAQFTELSISALHWCHEQLNE